MLTPTATLAFRLTAPGVCRTAILPQFGKTMQTSSSMSCFSTQSALKAQSRQMNILSRTAPFQSIRKTSPPASLILSRVVCRTQSTTASPTAASASTEGSQRLDWNTFFKLRKTRRRWQLLFSVTMLGVSGSVGAIVLSTGVAEPVLSQIPLDPFITLGLMVMGFAALGWLAGPSIGSTVFNLMNRRWKKQMTLKETEFFARVKKNRVDPSASGASNPVPDFYGENISSVAGYRQWLKDQRAFNKKRTRFV